MTFSKWIAIRLTSSLSLRRMTESCAGLGRSSGSSGDVCGLDVVGVAFIKSHDFHIELQEFGDITSSDKMCTEGFSL